MDFLPTAHALQSHNLAVRVTFPAVLGIRLHLIIWQYHRRPCSLSSEQTHAVKMVKQTVIGAAAVVTEKAAGFTHPRGTLRVLGILTAIEVVPSTALPTPSYPDTTGLAQ